MTAHSTVEKDLEPFTHRKEIEVEVDVVSDDEFALIESAFAQLHKGAQLPPQCNTESSPELHYTELLRQQSGDIEVELESMKIWPTLDISVSGPLSQLTYDGTLKVTDLSAQMWCERQLELQRLFPTEKTEAMTAGSSRHLQLELELHDVVPVEVETPADTWGLKLLNILTNLQELSSMGVTREIFVFGFLPPNYVPAAGVIDEVAKTDVQVSTARHPYRHSKRLKWQKDSSPGLYLVDYKTRKANSLPGFAQKETTRLQLSVYQLLFEQLQDPEFNWKKYLEVIGRSPLETFSPVMKRHLSQVGISSSATVGDVMQIVLGRFQSTERPCGRLEVRYEKQDDFTTIGIDEYKYDYQWTASTLNEYSRYWSGERPARGVDSSGSWKCRHCAYFVGCSSSPQAPPVVAGKVPAKVTAKDARKLRRDHNAQVK